MRLREALSVFSFVIICAGCDTEPSEVGADFFDDGRLDVSSIDSSKVILSTIKYDSLVTSGTARILLGSHADEKLGRITASAYFQPALNTGIVDLSDRAFVFEKLSILLKYDNYSFYDTSLLLQLNAYQLKEEIRLASDGNLYNTTAVVSNSTRLGSVSVLPKPHASDSIEIVLDDSFGAEFYAKYQNGHTDFSTNDKFVNYLKGFLVVPDSTTNSPVIGFSSAPELRLYYLDKSEIPTRENFISFSATSGYTATRIVTNRTTTKLKSLPDSKGKLIARQTDNQAYAQGSGGLSLRIDIPYLREIKQNTNFYLTKAVLEIYPWHNSYSGEAALPASLPLYIIDKQNRLLGQYTSQAVLLEDLELGRDTHYQVDATDFVRSQMERLDINEDALLVSLDDESLRASADRIYFASPSYQYNTRLKIYYVTILN